jgi:HK97 gp10 family phage protein
MNEVHVDVKGLPELKRKLEAAGPQLAARMMRAGLSKGIEIIAQAVLANTPYRTGELQQNLVVAVDVAPSGTSGVARVGFGKQGYIARFLEYGHRKVVRKGESQEVVGFVPANPFMRRAYESSKEQAREAVIEAIRAELKDIR